MSLIDTAVSELVGSINVLVRRRANTADPEEKKTIDKTIKLFNHQIAFLAQASMLQAARAVAEAADALEEVVAAARTGPFDHFLGQIEASIHHLSELQGQMHASEGLPSAEVESVPQLPAAAIGAMAPSPLAAPIDSNDFQKLAKEYGDYYAACKVRPGNEGNVAYYVERLQKKKATYEAAGSELGIPWEFVGIIHGLEGGFNFATHLHNGDPLTARTVNVPAGRPQVGSPPFTWQESAHDALIFEGFNHESDWSIPRMLFLWEKYNGFGYRKLGVPTPYLWSFSNLYTKGKFTSDGHFDPNAVSKQCGAAVMLKALRG